MKKIIFTLLTCMLALTSFAQSYKDSPNYRKSIAVFGGSFSVITPSDIAKAHWAECLGCQEMGVSFLNLYTTSGINRYNAVDFFGADLLHMNNAGYNHIKETQARFIATY